MIVGAVVVAVVEDVVVVVIMVGSLPLLTVDIWSRFT